MNLSDPIQFQDVCTAAGLVILNKGSGARGGGVVGTSARSDRYVSIKRWASMSCPPGVGPPNMSVVLRPSLQLPRPAMARAGILSALLSEHLQLADLGQKISRVKSASHWQQMQKLPTSHHDSRRLASGLFDHLDLEPVILGTEGRLGTVGRDQDWVDSGTGSAVCVCNLNVAETLQQQLDQLDREEQEKLQERWRKLKNPRRGSLGHQLQARDPTLNCRQQLQDDDGLKMREEQLGVASRELLQSWLGKDVLVSLPAATMKSSLGIQLQQKFQQQHGHVHVLHGKLLRVVEYPKESFMNCNQHPQERHHCQQAESTLSKSTHPSLHTIPTSKAGPQDVKAPPNPSSTSYGTTPSSPIASVSVWDPRGCGRPRDIQVMIGPHRDIQVMMRPHRDIQVMMTTHGPSCV